MSREIKFRAWNAKYSLMIDVGLIDFLEEKIHLGSIEYPLNRHPIMQYTGLQDKNGKEIYDGDVMLDDEGGVNVVEWSDTACWVLTMTFTNGSRMSEMLADYHNTFKLIGNIYEHPHLLGEKGEGQG